MYKILNGKRNPPSLDVMDKICKYMHLSPTETEELMEAYNITIFGYKNYYRRNAVKAFLSELTFSSTPFSLTEYQQHAFAPAEEVLFLNTPTEVNHALLYAVSREICRENGSIRMIVQPECQFLMNLLSGRPAHNGFLKIDHIICLNNSMDTTRPHICYNIDCLRTILGLYNSFDEYNCYYYYDNIDSKTSLLNLFSYLVMTSEYALLLSSDLQKGYLTSSADALRMFSEIFENCIRNVSPLFHCVRDVYEQLNIVTELFSCSEDICTLQLSPCVMPFLNRRIFEKYISEEIPDREFLIQALLDNTHRCSSVLCQNMTSIFSVNGIRNFLRTGILNEYPQRIYKPPLDVTDRIYLLQKLIGGYRNLKYRMLKKDIGNIKNELFLIVSRNKGYIMFQSPVKKSPVYLIIEEPSLLFAFLDFCENMNDDMFYTEDEAVEILQSLLSDMQDGKRHSLP